METPIQPQDLIKVIICVLACFFLHPRVLAQSSLHPKSTSSAVTKTTTINASKESNRSEPQEDYIPPGFENITNDYKGDAKISYNNTIIGNGQVDYIEHEDRITLSKATIALIIKAAQPDLTDIGKREVPKQLQSALLANTEVAASYLARSPHKVTVYFSINMLQLDVFIPPKFFKSIKRQYQYNRFHPPGKHRLGNKTSININRTQIKKNKSEIDWQVAGVLSSSKFSIHYQANNNLDSFFNKLYAQHLGKKHIYRLGYQQPFFTTMLAPSGNYWGLSIQANPRLINPKFYNAYKAPLIITLQKPYYVQILQRGNVLFSGNLNQGENVIPTQNFPPGSYPIEIKKRDLISGEETTSTQIFNNNISLYNWMYSGFQLIAGVRSPDFQLPTKLNTNNSYFRIQNGFNMLNGDIEFSYTFVDKQHYAGVRYDYISAHNFDYTLAAAVNTRGKLLATGSAFYKYHNSKYQLSLSNGYFPDDDTPKKATYSFGYYFYAKNWTLNAQVSYNNQSSLQLTFGVNRAFNWHNLPIGVNISGSHSKQNGSQITGSISLAFTQGNYSNNMNISQSINPANTIFNDSGIWRGGKNKQIYLSHKLRVPTGGKDTQADINGRYQFGLATLYGDLDMSNANNQLSIDRNQIGIKTNLINTLKSWKLTSQSGNSGFLVSLPTTNNSSKLYQINRKQYKGGQTAFIPTSSLSTQQLLIGSPSFDYMVKPGFYKSFLYPHNIHHVKVTIHRLCEVNFILNVAKNSYWHINNLPDTFIIGGYKSYTTIPEGTKLNLSQITQTNVQTQSCYTDLVVTCPDNKEQNLGNIRCINKKPKATIN